MRRVRGALDKAMPRATALKGLPTITCDRLRLLAGGKVEWTLARHHYSATPSITGYTIAADDVSCGEGAKFPALYGPSADKPSLLAPSALKVAALFGRSNF